MVLERQLGGHGRACQRRLGLSSVGQARVDERRDGPAAVVRFRHLRCRRRGRGRGGAPGADTSLPTPPPPSPSPAETNPPPPPETTPPPRPPPETTTPPATPAATPAATLPPLPPPTETSIATPPPPATLPSPVPPPQNASSTPPPTCLALVLSTREVPAAASSASAEPTHEVTLAITSATPVCAPYALELYAPGYGALRTARGWVPSDGGAPTAGVLRGTVPERWQGLGGGMGAVTLSFVVRGGPEGSEGAPAAVAVNGAPCAVAKA